MVLRVAANNYSEQLTKSTVLLIFSKPAIDHYEEAEIGYTRPIVYNSAFMLTCIGLSQTISVNQSVLSSRADLDILVWGGCTVGDPERYKNPNTSRGVWGHAPQKIFDIHALRQLLVQSEANILPQIVPEIWGIS